MILYHAITTYHILKFCTHKLRFHQNEDAILLVPNFLVRKPSGVIEPQLSEIFKKVYFFNWEDKSAASEMSAIETISREMTHVFGKDGLSSITEVNVASAAYLFSVWLIHNKINFQWFEEADGRLSQPEPIMNDDKRIFPLRYELAVKNGMYRGENLYVTRKFIKFDAQLPGFYDPMAVDFNVVKEMKLLSRSDQERLLRFFDVSPDLQFESGKSVLMMTQHFSNLNILSYADHALCYQLTSDYYLDGYTLYYKWHPSDLMPYPSFIENVHMIDGQFPAELMTLVIDSPFEVGASINSTGIYNLKSICKQVLTFDQDYLNTFWHNHQYYFAVKLLEHFPDHEVVALGVNHIQFENMCHFSGENVCCTINYQDTININASGKKVYLIGKTEKEVVESIDLHYEELSPDSIFVFLNLYDKYECLPLMRKFPFIVKEIRINDMDSHCLRPFLDCRRIIIFASDDGRREKVEKMKYTKRLLNTGAETVVFESMEKDIQIAALNGMLKATEKMLQEYMEENELLKKKLNKKY